MSESYRAKKYTHHITVVPAVDSNKWAYYIDYDIVDTSLKEFVYHRCLRRLKTDKEAQRFAEKAAVRLKASLIGLALKKEDFNNNA